MVYWIMTLISKSDTQLQWFSIIFSFLPLITLKRNRTVISLIKELPWIGKTTGRKKKIKDLFIYSRVTTPVIFQEHMCLTKTYQSSCSYPQVAFSPFEIVLLWCAFVSNGFGHLFFLPEMFKTDIVLLKQSLQTQTAFMQGFLCMFPYPDRIPRPLKSIPTESWSTILQTLKEPSCGSLL